MTGAGRVAAVIPAYQAAASVGDIVRRTRSVLTDVLVVDDGSTDGTGRAARDAGARVLTHPANRGKCSALATAFADLFGAGFDAVVTLDADGQHLPEEIPRLLAAGDAGADLVLGIRDHLFAEMSRVRRLSNRFSSRGISILAGRRLPDIQTGFRLYARPLVETLGFAPGRFETESAIVVLAARAGFRIDCVQVQLGRSDGRVGSHYRPYLDSWRIAQAVIWARFSSRRAG